MKEIILVLGILFSNNIIAQSVNGKIDDSKNIKILTIWGTHQERGFAYGYLLGSQISETIATYQKVVSQRELDNLKELYKSGILKLRFVPNIVTEAKAMIDGMNITGTNIHNIDYLELLLINSLFDLKSIHNLPKVKSFACSALMSWGNATKDTDLDGASVVSRHFDWFNSSEILKNQIIVVHIPSEINEQSWLSIGFAGQIGVTSGINERGVSGFINALPFAGGKGNIDLVYEPVTFALRQALEVKDYNNDGKDNASDIRDFILRNPNGYAEGALIYSMATAKSNTGNEIALIIESTPDFPHFTFRTIDYDDNIPGDNLYVANSLLKKNDRISHGRRNKDVVKAFKKYYPEGTKLSSFDNWNLLKEYSQFCMVANIESNIQFMQFIPEKGEIRLSVSYDKTPAYVYDPEVFYLSDLFMLD